MFKTLLKKQIKETFKAHFFNAKKNEKRSLKATIGLFSLFIFLTFGLVGGTVTVLAALISPSLVEADVAFFYFLIFSTFSIVFGAFGSIFSTYSGLYLNKDNDLLLSLPIPPRYIIASRLLNVYLQSLMYSSVVSLPTVIVYWVVAGLNVSRFICGIILVFILSLIVLILSCLLGWVVARISMRFKNKSFLIVFVALLGITLYYVGYYFMQEFIKQLVENAAVYGQSLKDNGYFLYMFGSIGEGHWLHTLIFFLSITAIALALWSLLSFNYVKIITSSAKSKKAVYKEKTMKKKSLFMTSLSKEFKRFTASANYMLNCGLGTLFIVIIGICALIFGKNLIAEISPSLTQFNGLLTAIVCAMIFSFSSMNDSAAPSVSLEGKNIWIYQSLPIKTKTVLHAKAATQIILTTVPFIFLLTCLTLILNISVFEIVLMWIVSLSFAIFNGYLSLFYGIRFANINWINEITPVKQSLAVTLALFSGWGIAIVFIGFYFLFSVALGLSVVFPLLGFILLLIILTILLVRYINTRGCERFMEL